MLETLAGRLKWERTRDGICIQLPRRFRLEALLGIVMAFCIPVWIDDIIRKSPIKGTGLSLGTILCSGLCIAVALLSIHLSSRTILVLTHDELKKAIYVLGGPSFRRTGRNDQLYDLRRNLMVSEWTGKDRANQNVVEINRDVFDYTLAYGLTDLEAAV